MAEKENNSEAVKPKTPKDLGVTKGYDQNIPFSMDYKPIGKNATKGLLYEEQDVDLEGDPTVYQLHRMRQEDGQAQALYRLLTLPIRSALRNCTFVAAEDGEEEREFIERVFLSPPGDGGMTVTFQRVMSQILRSLFYGFSAFEKVFDIPKEGPLKGKVVLKKLAYRPPETVTFITDKDGGFAGIRQRVTVHGELKDVFIPREYVFYYSAQEEEKKYYGQSYFQTAYTHFDQKRRLYFLAHVSAQRSAVGTRIGTIGKGADTEQVSAFKSSLANLSAAQWMTIPEGYKVEIMRETSSFDFLGQINHQNSQMSKSILAPFFDQSQGSGKTDNTMVSFGGPGDAMFVLMQQSIMEEIADQINHYVIPQLIDLNFDSRKYPRFTWGSLTDEQRAGVTKTFEKLSSVVHESSSVSDEFMRELEKLMADTLGLEIDYEEVAAREEREKQEQLALERAELEAKNTTGVEGVAPSPSDPVQQVETNDAGIPLEWGVEEFEESLEDEDDNQEPVKLSKTEKNLLFRVEEFISLTEEADS